jgi:tRNA(adenine34) deaminase
VFIDDEAQMAIALGEADLAAREGEAPVGCVIRGPDGAELARAHNLREQLKDATAHAEVVALRRAAKVAGSWRLPGATVYVTLEPCIMCAGALMHARVARVVYGCDDPKGGGAFSLYSIGQDPRLNHQYELSRGVMAEAASARLQEFFGRLRRAGKK